MFFRSSKVFLTIVLPFICSEPTLSNPNFGFFIPRTDLENISPISANWTKFSLEHSTLAPRSKLQFAPHCWHQCCNCRSVNGLNGFKTNLDIAINAPVLPAETNPSHSLSLTELIQAAYLTSLIFSMH